MGTTSAALARPKNHPCAGGCGAVWQGHHNWITCWCCPGSPLALCPPCGREHVATPACQKAHAKGAEGAA